MSSPIYPVPPRAVIYQLLVRTFGNTNPTRKFNGTMLENGCGKFHDISEAALVSLRAMGFTHLWLTGVLEQASGTAYPNRLADVPDILKGIAGSPYAIKDYFDVCPDYALDPDKRLDEFKELLDRCHALGLRVIIDFVPNHVARSYASDVMPERCFGRSDNKNVFFDRDNHFYYLAPQDAGNGPPLRLPTLHLPGCDGLFLPETHFGRVTGNNVISWAPALHDWYETVKLNYGHDFTQGRATSALPGRDAATSEVPKTWRTMDEILGYWQALGVDGFRVDMAHLIPMEFWRWAVKRARERQPDTYFSAEAYDTDPAKLVEGDVLEELLMAGFDAVYDKPIYDMLEGIYQAGKWANDIDALTSDGKLFHRSLRFAENHDEVRIANTKVWGGLGMKTGKPVSAVLFALSRGSVMLYHGQEVGEPADGAEGFSGDDARTSIFDYGSMSEFTKWVNGGKYDGGGLSEEQKDLRHWYRRLIHATQSPAFTAGEFYGLNDANKLNPRFGRVGDESFSGHWLYAFLRHDAVSGQSYLIVANFHGWESLQGVKVHIPLHALEFMSRGGRMEWEFTDQLATTWQGRSDAEGLVLPNLEPCSALILEISG